MTEDELEDFLDLLERQIDAQAVPTVPELKEAAQRAAMAVAEYRRKLSLGLTVRCHDEDPTNPENRYREIVGALKNRIR